MKGLVLVAHGSRRQASNDEVRMLADRVRLLAGDRYAHVGHAYLELAEPSIPDGIEAAIGRGVREVVVVPCFLSAGRHVREDVPAEVAIKQREHPDVAIRIAPWLGSDADGVAGLLLACAANVEE